MLAVFKFLSLFDIFLELYVDVTLWCRWNNKICLADICPTLTHRKYWSVMPLLCHLSMSPEQLCMTRTGGTGSSIKGKWDGANFNYKSSDIFCIFAVWLPSCVIKHGKIHQQWFNVFPSRKHKHLYFGYFPAVSTLDDTLDAWGFQETVDGWSYCFSTFPS